MHELFLIFSGHNIGATAPVLYVVFECNNITVLVKFNGGCIKSSDESYNRCCDIIELCFPDNSDPYILNICVSFIYNLTLLDVNNILISLLEKSSSSSSSSSLAGFSQCSVCVCASLCNDNASAIEAVSTYTKVRSVVIYLYESAYCLFSAEKASSRT